MTPIHAAAPGVIDTEGHPSNLNNAMVRRTADTAPATKPTPEPDDGGRSTYRDPTGDRAVRNLMRGRP